MSGNLSYRNRVHHNLLQTRCKYRSQSATRKPLVHNLIGKAQYLTGNAPIRFRRIPAHAVAVEP